MRTLSIFLHESQTAEIESKRTIALQGKKENQFLTAEGHLAANARF